MTTSADLREYTGGSGRAWTGEPIRRGDPARIGGYDVHARLGSGATADIFLGTSPLTGAVAIKVLREDGPGSESCRDEFELMGRVDQRYTPGPHSYGWSDSGPYLTMSYLPDHTPLSRVVQDAVTGPEMWRIAAASARAIAAVHAAGVIHCDIKPGNVLVGDAGDVRVIDFGIARLADDQPECDGMVRCSRGWAAPEQLYPDELTPAVDVFGWGCMMAYLSTGVRPFPSTTQYEWIEALEHGRPDVNGVPPGLNGLVRDALANNPADRPAATELAAECLAYA